MSEGRMRPGWDNPSILPLEWAFWQAEISMLMAASNPTSRFSDRVENYVRYRPGYPAAALDILRNECGLTPEHAIADIASGTGIWSRLLLGNRNFDFGVEPKPQMREAGERLLAAFSTFISVEGNAEASTFGDGMGVYVTDG